jgi:hypothetical protein
MNFFRTPYWCVVFAWFLYDGELGHGAGKISFNRDVRPILSEACFACHGPDANKREAELRLDQRDSALHQKAIVPGNVQESKLIARILTSNEDEVMPPPASHKVLTKSQKETLKTWIEQGAEYEGHWAFIPPTKPELPQVRNGNWVRNPIDRFTLAELEHHGLAPAPEAELRALIRRVSLDLTGLPPSPEDVERVLSDSSAECYENYVDELLKRPTWGEHRGRYWLDYARYADTHGIHFDNYREMWSYREWVINAFNRNQAFDQFTIEQLAGDLLPDADLDQRIATGFNRCNITTNEGGTIAEEYKVLYTRDRVETTSQVWLGLTVGCAVCHDHKFDPISQKDFYQLAAFFNNTTQAAMDGNIKDTPPIVDVPRFEDRARWIELDRLLESNRIATAARREAAKSDFDAFLANAQERERLIWQPLTATESLEAHLPLTSGNPNSLDLWYQGQWFHHQLKESATLGNGHVSKSAWQIKNEFPSLPAGNFERDQPFTVSMWTKPASANQAGSLIARMDESNSHRGWDVWMENGAIGMHLIHQWPNNAIKVIAKPKLRTDRWQHVVITYDGSSKAEGIKIRIDGEEVQKNIASRSLTDTIQTNVPLTLGRRSAGSPAANAMIQDVRVYRKELDATQSAELRSVPRLRFLAGKEKREPQETEEFFEWYLSQHDQEFQRLQKEGKELTAEKLQLKSRGTVAHIMNEAKDPPKAYILTRGEYDKRAGEVFPDVPSILPPWQAEWPRNRLGLARWLVQPSHPLTARVTVNRFWQEVFGTGLVNTSGDFGASGQMPSHPDLLDYLAVTFVEDGWNVKSLFRQIVTSATYRQSASVSPEKLAADPTNKWMSRGPRFRMDAEMIRDHALVASSLLVQKTGGPSVKPYQPPGVWEAVAMPESNTRKYVADQNDGLYRRSVYTFLKRAAPPPNMDVFNATAREVCTIRRERTNTPLQALVTLNDVQFVEAARVLASAILADPALSADTSARLQSIAMRLLARPLRAEELNIVRTSLADLLSYYQLHPDLAKQLIAEGASKPNANLEPAELAAWTMLVNELMNLDEVLTK